MLQELKHTGLVVLQHVASSQTRDQTRVLCIGRWILISCATKEVPTYILEQRSSAGLDTKNLLLTPFLLLRGNHFNSFSRFFGFCLIN